MTARTLFITGTDTDVGKTVLTTLLTQYLRERGARVAALKPICSGDRDDARVLGKALGGALTLDEINPWHFRAPLAPLLAARRERRTLKRIQVLAHVRRIGKRFPLVIIEGAGGLLSPLGEDFDSRDLITELHATPIVVCVGRLGAINQTLLALAALPRALSRRAPVVLMPSARSDAASRGSARFLAGRLGPARIHVFPWLRFPGRPDHVLSDRRVCDVLGALTRAAVIAL